MNYEINLKCYKYFLGAINIMTINDLKQNQTNDLITSAELSNSPLPESVDPSIIPNPAELTTENTPLADTTIEEPKQDIMNHLKQINGDFSYFSAEAKERSSKIREHIQKSLSWEKVEISVL